MSLFPHGEVGALQTSLNAAAKLNGPTRSVSPSEINMNPQPWTLSAEAVLALPIDDLAMRVLQDANDTHEWNWHNWLIKARNHAYPSRPDVLTVLSEAWTWLINRGLVVWDPRQSAEAAIVVSRQGAEAMTRGLPWLRAVQRLDVELVPILEAKGRPQFLCGLRGGRIHGHEGG